MGFKGPSQEPTQTQGVQQVVGGLLALPRFPRPHCCSGCSAGPRRSASPAWTISPRQARGIQSRPTRPAVQRQGSTETRRARLRDQALHITLTTLRKTSPGLGAQQEHSGTSLIRSVHWCLLSTYCVPDTPLRAGHRAANKPSDQGVIRGTRQVCSVCETQHNPLISSTGAHPTGSSQASSSRAPVS